MDGKKNTAQTIFKASLIRKSYNVASFQEYVIKKVNTLQGERIDAFKYFLFCHILCCGASWKRSSDSVRRDT